ncbi:YceI family protein [Pseudonocardia sp. 73-21]|uniref:YceI family protein n=1 Tax=Pseudonocardia sp. 73-21 TaxID=1895809 RepID=UPI0026182847|nr:YceI family protein [Pseudonocardia sp. 73-21]
MNAPPVLATGRYMLVAQRCTVGFTARSLGLAVPGAMSVRSGEVVVDGTGATVAAVLDAASFRTRSARRDRDVRGPRFLDAGEHPDIVVTGRWDGPGTPVHGELTVRGVAAPVEIAVVEIAVLDVLTEGNATTVRARARVDRRAFPVGPRSGPIGRWVDVELEIPLVGV